MERENQNDNVVLDRNEMLQLLTHAFGIHNYKNGYVLEQACIHTCYPSSIHKEYMEAHVESHFL